MVYMEIRDAEGKGAKSSEGLAEALPLSHEVQSRRPGFLNY